MNLGKYIEVLKMILKNQMAYRFDTLNSAAMSFFRVYLSYLLWRIIYESNETVGGYTFAMMLTYYIISSLFMKLNKADFVVWEMSDDIRNGRFTKYITRPLNPLKYYITACYAKTMFTFGINLTAFIFWILIFKEHFLVQKDPFILMMVLVFVMIGIFITIQTNYFIATFAFKTMDVIGLYFMFLGIIEFFSGALIPLSLLPENVLALMRYFPYYYTLYFPSALYLGQRTDEIPFALVVSLLWAVSMYLVNKMFYQRLYKSYEGVGA